MTRPWEASCMCLGRGRAAGYDQAVGGQLCVTRPWEASCMCLGRGRAAVYVGHGRPAVCV